MQPIDITRILQTELHQLQLTLKNIGIHIHQIKWIDEDINRVEHKLKLQQKQFSSFFINQVIKQLPELIAPYLLIPDTNSCVCPKHIQKALANSFLYSFLRC